MASIFTNLASAIWPTNATNKSLANIRQWGLEIETALAALLETFGPPIYNGRIQASVNANVLTVAIKTAALADPSSSDPVYFTFRDPTATDGDIDHVEVSAALSLTISAGSLMGVVSADTAFRLWLVAFNDADTVRLGLVNLNGGTVLYPLEEGALASSTAEGGGGGADSTAVIYTGTAVTSKPFRILGYLTWESGLATPGLYATAPTTVQMMGPGVHRPGDVVQRPRAENATGAETTTATQLPADDTTPQNTEGVELMTLAITPVSAANVLDITGRLNLAHSAAGVLSAALFQDSTAGALAARGHDIAAADDAIVLEINHRMLAGTASSTTLKVRAGSSAAGDLMFNGVNGTQFFDGVGYSTLEIAEIFI